ncbi:MAG TPA: potassium-transporting ATPase subunit KdpC [Bellilinea sp.]|nr:potassium-transporting ATPase subunit KdpC [Bellilinea sp.]
MLKIIRPAFVLLGLFTLLTGLIYPSAVTGLAQVFFPSMANGSLIDENGVLVGSELIGQAFSDPKYFWGRPSATAAFPYNAAASGASNLSPANPVFIQAIEERAASLQAADPGNQAPIPIDLLTSSGSGLDPHISVAAAIYQAPRVARKRGLPETEILDLINQNTEKRLFGVLGEPRVNVLKLNLALDRIDETAFIK